MLFKQETSVYQLIAVEEKHLCVGEVNVLGQQGADHVAQVNKSDFGIAFKHKRSNGRTVNANWKLLISAEMKCHFSPDSIGVYTALITVPLVGLKPVKS